MTPELGRRIAFMLGALLVYRLGTYIPLPGIAPSVWEQVFRSQAGGILGMFNVFSGGGIHRMAIFALGLMPLLSAAIIIQVLTIVSSKLKALRKQGERGRRTIDAYTLYLTALLAIFQSFGIAIGLEGVSNLVSEPGWLFRISTVLTLTGGVMVLTWLAGQITARGLGNGVALILCAGIVVELPAGIAGTLELGRQGVLSSGNILALLAWTIALTALIVVVERARRRLLVHSQAGEVSNRWHLPFKLNSAGVMPTVFASWILSLPMAIAFAVVPQWSGGPFRHGGPLFLLAYGIVMMVCTFLYTAFLVDPDEVAETIRRRGGFIPGLSPGELTAEHIDYVVTRITVIGAAYLTLVYLGPAVLAASVPAPVYFGGASFLIVVCTILDLEDHIRAFASIKPGAQHQ
jgi:preprotein translocase subunit SecY